MTVAFSLFRRLSFAAIVRVTLGLLLSGCLSGCLIHSAVVSDNLSQLYVPEEQMLLIAGTTASVPDLNPFTIDSPIPYEVRTNSAGEETQFKVYSNEFGDQLLFERVYDSGTDQYWESVTVRPEEGEEFTLVRVAGYLGSRRSIAYGVQF